MTHWKMKLLSLLLLIFSSSLAFSHAIPKSQSPGAGEVITSKATTVAITFNSKIEPVFSVLAVTNAQHSQVSIGKGTVDPKNNFVLQTQIPALAEGEYQVIWSVVAIDGHHTHGSYNFTVK